MDEILLLLLRKKAHRNPVGITTKEIGYELGISQQNASRKLIELEKHDKIERGKKGILITQKGLKEIKELYAEIKNSLEKERLFFKGKITEGFNEGKYYISLKQYANRIKRSLGFLPYPGTLNVKIEDMQKRYQLKKLEPVIVEGFKMKGRSFGDIYAYPCEVNGLKAAIIIPTRTHHGMDILEIISNHNLKKKLKKKTGDSVTVEIR